MNDGYGKRKDDRDIHVTHALSTQSTSDPDVVNGMSESIWPALALLRDLVDVQSKKKRRGVQSH